MRRELALLLAVIMMITSIQKPVMADEIAELDEVALSDAGADYSLIGNQRNDGDSTTWDCVYFGRYWQEDTNGDGKVDTSDEKLPIKWRVLSANGTDAFLISDRVLDLKKYNETDEETDDYRDYETKIKWATCTLRSWLNGYDSSNNICEIDYSSNGGSFISNAFSDSEKSAIMPKTLKNTHYLPEYSDIVETTATTDKVFLLSYEEADEYLNGFSLCARPTSFIPWSESWEEGKVLVWEKTKTAPWWLRSPSRLYYDNYDNTMKRTVMSIDLLGENNGKAMTLPDSGIEGCCPNASDALICVRPALHLDLSSSDWSHAGLTTIKSIDNQGGYPVVYTDSYIVTFDANGGTVLPKSQIVALDDVYGELPTLTRIGYGFEGWYTDKENGELVTKDTVMTRKENHTLYARWHKYDFTLEDGNSDSSIEACSCGVKNINYKGLDDKVISKDIEYTGSPVSPDVTISGLIKDTDYSLADVSETEPGTYSVFANGIGAYAGVRNVTWKIVATAPSLTLPVPEATYKQKLGDVEISNPAGNVAGTWTWNNPAAILNTVGECTYKATFTPNDTTRWLKVEKELKVTVGKGSYSPSSDYSKSYVFSREYANQSIDLRRFVPDDAGKATFTISDKNFNVKDTVNNVGVVGNYLNFGIEKMDVFSDNTSTIISIKVTTDNYIDYVKKINITRSNCKHPSEKTIVKYLTLPTCEKNGIGQVECTECNTIIESEIIVDALSHHYVEGVCDREDCGVISLKLCKDIEVDIENVKYDGEIHDPTVTVSIKGKELIEGNDYTIDSEAQKEVGSYALKITGIGQYRDDISWRWSIYSPKGLWCSDIDDQVYTGKQIKPEIDVYSDGKLLTKGKDYTLSYGKYNTNVAAKTAKNPNNNKSIAPSVTIIGKGNYSGSNPVYFSIVPKSVDNANVDDIIAAKPRNNNAVKVTPVVMLDGKKLKAGTDYVVSKTVNVNDAVTEIKDSGKYTLYIIGKGNYSGTKVFNFTITEDVMASEVSIGKISNQKYCGIEIVPDIKITYPKSSNDVTDKFDIEFENNKEIGTATVIVTAKKNSGFAGTKEATFKITGTKISVAKLGADGRGKIDDLVYNGNRHTPELNLYAGSEPLVKGIHYTVTYTNNVNAGTATATVTGKGKYTGTKKFKFKISKYDAEKDSSNVIRINNGASITDEYVKGGVMPKPVVSMNGIILKEKTDYTLSYANNKAVAGESVAKAPAIMVKFKGNYSGKKTVNFTITSKDMAKCTLAIADMTGSEKPNKWKQTKAVVTDTNGRELKAGTDYEKTFKYYSDSACTSELTAEKLDAGTRVYVKIAGINNYAGSSAIGSYYVSKNNISSVSAAIADQYYTGGEICPTEITVTVGKGANQKTLTAGTDYEIVAGSYKNNINKGTASVTIKGKGDYYGTKVVKFRILIKEL